MKPWADMGHKTLFILGSLSENLCYVTMAICVAHISITWELTWKSLTEP